ncbi:MAG TPA: omptin family outer membrane protease, partial [Burkholderiales bacterium]|nr:omptin family outer membrane protease [Burkholderiales bacterium]
MIAAVPLARASGADLPVAADKSWSVDVRIKNYFRSHTSYEFGNPFPPNQAPLSRLEFPLNTQWIGMEARRSFPRLSAGIEVSTNIRRQVSGANKDSDWEDSDVLSIYSESGSRMEPSYIVRGDADLEVSDWLGLPDRIDLRPVIGFRWQRFSLVSHDGTQYYPSSGGTVSPDALPGDSIQFEQTYRQYFLGMRAAYDLSGILPMHRLKLYTQLDWAYVEGNNEDRHLLRAGNRLTYEHTIGDAWHALLGLQCGLTENLSARL